MMIAGGIDLGGTKIEAQIFDANWQLSSRRRINTPNRYAELVEAMANQIAWIDGEAGAKLPVGIAAAGLVNPATGLALTANLPAMGQPFPTDINAAVGRSIAYVNDCRALTLSEAVFGAAKGQSPAIGLIIGTGIGGGVAVNGTLLQGPAHLGGEFGHFAVAADPVLRHGLPIIRCGCGRVGCTETLVSGPGLARIVRHRTGRTLSAPDIVAARGTDPDIADCWSIWCELVAEMLLTLCLTVDPACIVLGGGLSKAPNLVSDLSRTLQAAQLNGFTIPSILLAEGGDASGARGAAFVAYSRTSGHE